VDHATTALAGTETFSKAASPTTRYRATIDDPSCRADPEAAVHVADANVVVAEEGVRAAAMYLRVGVSLGRSCDADKGGGGQQGYK
jgi:hypothetical protein